MTPFEQGFLYTMKCAGVVQWARDLGPDDVIGALNGAGGVAVTGGAGAALADIPTLTMSPWERFKDDVTGDGHRRAYAGLAAGLGLGTLAAFHPRTRDAFRRADWLSDV